MRCWACEDLLALADDNGQLIIEADADLATTGGGPAMRCPCGARTVIAVAWDIATVTDRDP